MSNLNRCVTLKENLANMDVRIGGCEDTYIYIDECVKYLQLVNCVNTTIFVAAVSKCVSVDKCENITICVATQFIRIGNCVDCTVHSYSQLSPPLVYGDTRSLILAPHNAGCFELLTALKNANIAFISLGSQV